MVKRSAPSAWTASTVQDFTAVSLSMTVHAPQTLVSQPTWVPVSPATSRRKSTRSSRGSTSWVCSTPLILTETFFFGSASIVFPYNPISPRRSRYFILVVFYYLGENLG